MKRNAFIGSMAIITSLPSIMFTKGAALTKNIGKAFKAKSGEGRKYGHLQLKGVNANVLDVKVSGSDTDGSLAIFEQTG